MSDHTPTAARPTSRKDSHWYSSDGQPRYELIGKTTGKPRPVTLRDARENNWLPSVTTILKVLHKEGLVNWLIEQSVLACLTTPQNEGEALDAFIERVLHVEKVQDQETQIARDKGTEIHAAIEDYFTGLPVSGELAPWIMPAIEELQKFGRMAATEKILVGRGYAGKADLIQDCPDCWRVWDVKSTKTLPRKGAWPEHRLQLAAYARAWESATGNDPNKWKPTLTGNIYISTENQGEFVIAEHEEWQQTYEEGFAPLVRHWCWANDYWPAIPQIERAKSISTSSNEVEKMDMATVEQLAGASDQVAPAQRRAAIKVLEPATSNVKTTMVRGRKVVYSEGVVTSVTMPTPPAPEPPEAA